MAGRARTANSATQVFGLALISAALLTLMTLDIVLFGGEDAVSFAPVVAILVVVTFVVWRFDKTWARVLGLVFTLTAAGFLFFLALGLFRVFSPVEFIVGLVFVLGVLLALIGGIRAIMAARRGENGPTEGEVRLRTRVLAVIGAAAVVSIVGFFFTKGGVSDAEAAGAVALEMTNFEFEPSSSSVAAEGKLLIHNSDAFVHDFTLDALDIKLTVGPGSEALVDLSDAAPGTYDYFCSLHSDGIEGMRGTVTIES